MSVSASTGRLAQGSSAGSVACSLFGGRVSDVFAIRSQAWFWKIGRAFIAGDPERQNLHVERRERSRSGESSAVFSWRQP